MKKTLIFLTVFSMLLCTVGLAAAVGPLSESNISFYTQIKGKGQVTIRQSGHENTIFENQMKIDKGTIDFKQNINTVYGKLINNVRLNGNDLKFNNCAGEESGTIQFEQQLYAGESSTNWDEVKSKQTFRVGNKYISQNVQVNPTANSGIECEPDRLNMKNGERGQFGMLSVMDGYMAMLGQKGKATGDYILAEQMTNIGGFARSKVESLNNNDWVNFEQMLMFSSMLE